MDFTKNLEIKNVVSENILTGNEVKFEWPVEAEELAKAVYGRPWRSSDDKMQRVYLNTPDTLTKFYFWRKDERVWVLSGGKKDPWKTFRREAFLLSVKLCEDYSRKWALKILNAELDNEES